jgi:hypothetical protein
MHLIKTRFMQHQANLTHLALARFHLFRAFCLPSIVAQTNQHFIWLISVDPDLPPDLLSQLKQAVQPYPHFYLTLTTDSLRPGSGLHGIGNEIITGDVNILRRNLENYKKLTILETQLDADDALHVQYVQDLQQRAKQAFLKDDEEMNPGPDWMYWCIHQDLEWHWIMNDPKNKANDLSVTKSSLGWLKPSRSFIRKQKCYTPGMALGLKQGRMMTGILDVPHSQLIAELNQSQTSCGSHYKGLDCVDFLDQLKYPALRTRTPTSASMVNVELEKSRPSSENAMALQKNLLEQMIRDFAVQPVNVQQVHEYLTDNMALIVNDAIAGQCSHGHSCRPEARNALLSFAKAYHVIPS